MTNEKSNTTDRELRFTRMLDAPIDLVWDIWTSKEHIQNWWGPDGYLTTVAKMDVKDGGEWDLTMTGSTGDVHRHKCVYKEVVKHKKIVYEQLTDFNYVATIEFESHGDKTFLSWHILFESKEYLAHCIETVGVNIGFSQSTARLLNYIKEIS